MSESQDEGSDRQQKTKFNNALPFWGNATSMNLNNLVLTNIQSSTYFKVSLFKLKTYHEVIDEIYYQVKHMEPWEKGSRKTGQTGMCGGVRGVGAGGIVSSAYCLLYKLYTLRLTRKQINGLLTHSDSPYIRALGFMYLRYTQPPGDLYDWYEEYLQDEEEIDVKAGGGQLMTIGQMLVQWLTKLDWFSTLFPRIPVPIQKTIQSKLEDYAREYGTTLEDMTGVEAGAGNKHNNNKRQDWAGQEEKGGGRNNYNDSNDRFQRGEYQGSSGGRGRGGGGGRDDGRAGNRHYNKDDRQSSSSSSYRPKSSRSRSRSPARSSKYYQSEGDSHRHNRRRSPSEGDKYDSYSRRGGDRERDDYYERDSYKTSSSSSSSHRKHY